ELVAGGFDAVHLEVFAAGSPDLCKLADGAIRQCHRPCQFGDELLHRFADPERRVGPEGCIQRRVVAPRSDEQAGDALLKELQAFDPAVLEAAGNIADRRQKRLDQFPAGVRVAAFGRDHQIPFLQSGESLLNHGAPIGRRSRFSHSGLELAPGRLIGTAMSNVQIRSETGTGSASAGKAGGAREADRGGRPGVVGLVRVGGVLGPVLRGRTSECARLDELLSAVRRGESGTLVLRGEAGMGKTALLDYASRSCEGCRVIRAGGVESEMELPFAALHQLCIPLLDGVERLPAPQRDALRTAFGLMSGPRPDRFLVGLAVLTLLSDAAEPQPLIWVVDDAQWLDRSSAQVLSFVARRLEAESVVVLFAERDQDQPTELAGLPELALQRLTDADARELLASSTPGRLDERVRQRMLDEAGGNPLALLELPSGASSASLAGGFAVADSLPLMSRVEASFRRRVDQLPEETQRLLLLAAAEPTGDPMLLWQAADALGLSIEAAAAAEAADLIAVGTRVTFRHPLLRSAIYRAASADRRRNAHRALAQATDTERDPDRRAWHRAHAALAPDEEVARELELSADRARARGGVAAAAAFLQRAVALTVDPARRAERALAAAQASLEAGAFDAALGVLATAEAGPLDECQRARLDLVRGRIAAASSTGSAAAQL